MGIQERELGRQTVIRIQADVRPVFHLEAHLRAIRASTRLSTEKFAQKIPLSWGRYKLVEFGDPNNFGKRTSQKIVQFISENIAPDNPHAVGAISIFEACQSDSQLTPTLPDKAEYKGGVIFEQDPSQQMYRLAKAKFDKPSAPLTEDEKWYEELQTYTFGEIIKKIRIYDNLTQANFAQELTCSLKHIRDMEAGKYRARMPLVNDIIDYAFSDHNGKNAQLFRLKSQDKAPMTLEELQRATPGQIVAYLLTLRGLYPGGVADSLNRSRSAIRNIIVGRDIPTWLHESITRVLQIDPDEPISKILQQKILNKHVSLQEYQLREVLYGEFLFTQSLMTNNVITPQS